MGPILGTDAMGTVTGPGGIILTTAGTVGTAGNAEAHGQRMGVPRARVEGYALTTCPDARQRSLPAAPSLLFSPLLSFGLHHLHTLTHPANPLH